MKEPSPEIRDRCALLDAGVRVMDLPVKVFWGLPAERVFQLSAEHGAIAASKSDCWEDKLADAKCRERFVL